MRGGVTFKVQFLKKALENRGVDIQLLDSWNMDFQLGKNDLVHMFNANVGTYHMAKSLQNYGAKYVINPIFYNRHPNWKIQSYLNAENIARKFLKGILSEFQMTKDICNGAEKILPNTIAEGDILANGIGVNPQKIEVVHNGVEKRFANADAKLFYEKYGLKNFVLSVTHIGSSRKNVFPLIKALQKIDVPAVIIGNVHQNAEGKRCVQEISKSKNIKLIQWIKHDDPLLESAYAGCKCFALPAKYETPGRAALEAGLAGANVVITPFGGTKEYFKNFAKYPNPYSVNSIKNEIETALNAPKNDDLKNYILDNFIWDKIAEKTVKMYETIF